MPVYGSVTNEIVPLVICQEEKTFSVSAEVDATSSSCTIFEDTAVYEFDVQNIFDIKFEMECVLSDHINNECFSINPAKDPEYCEVVVEYYHIVTNISPKPQTNDKLVRNFNGNYNDLT